MFSYFGCCSHKNAAQVLGTLQVHQVTPHLRQASTLKQVIRMIEARRMIGVVGEVKSSSESSV